MNPMRILLLPLSVLALTGTAQASGDVDALHAMFEKEWAFRMQEHPESASAWGLEGHGDGLDRVGAEDLERRYRFWQGILAEAEAFDCDALPRTDCINLRLFKRQISHFVRQHELGGAMLPFSNDSGFWTAWARLPAETTFRDADDYREYIARLQMLPAVMDEYIALLQKGLDTGMTQPRVILDGVAATMQAQLVDDPEASGFYAPFLDMDERVSAQTREELRAAARAAVADGVLPAYRRLHEFFTSEYMPRARQSLAAHALPNGQDYYREQVRWYVTLDLAPHEIHEMGLNEVRRIRAEMDEVIAESGFEGSFAEFIEFLRTDPQFYADTARELLAEASFIAKKVDGQLPRLFGRLPRQPYGIEPVPEDIAPYYTTGRAVPAPLDADRGGYYWVNTYDLSSRPLYELPALTVHEAAPGHLMQIALSMELGEQPPFRRFDYISAYGEGWGLYSEKLGLEFDIYTTPYEHFGRLSYEMWRAARLVVDTGIHAMGWTREQAREFMASNTALALHNVNTEIDRYISWPGQALSYKIGEMTIIRLREEAAEALGENFDLRAYHDFVLGLGSVPLDVLEDEVRHWIAGQQAAQS